jgi:hypothetical protein
MVCAAPEVILQLADAVPVAIASNQHRSKIGQWADILIPFILSTPQSFIFCRPR